MSSVDESISLAITECETTLSCESSESSHVTATKHHNSFVNGLAEVVTNFKARALLLEDEQESLLATLMNLREECSIPSPSIAGLGEGTVDFIDELTNTLMDVNLKVTTKRSNHEEEALHQVNLMINNLVSKVTDADHYTKELCRVYIRSCYPPGQCTEETSTGDEDLFQSIIIKCAPDDIHRIRRRLHGLLKYIDSRLKDIYTPTLDSSN